MHEIEMKFKVDDEQQLVSKLEELQYKASVRRTEEDIYYSAPDRDFAKTDEALRFRNVFLVDERGAAFDQANILTYKGPKQGNKGKIRKEVEVPFYRFSEIETMKEMLDLLGYKKVLTVCKHRTFYYLTQSNLEVTLDTVAGLGTFVELEIRSENTETAMQQIEDLASKLGLDKEERRSYLELLLEKGKDVN